MPPVRERAVHSAPTMPAFASACAASASAASVATRKSSRARRTVLAPQTVRAVSRSSSTSRFDRGSVGAPGRRRRHPSSTRQRGRGEAREEADAASPPSSRSASAAAQPRSNAGEGDRPGERGHRCERSLLRQKGDAQPARGGVRDRLWRGERAPILWLAGARVQVDEEFLRLHAQRSCGKCLQW